MLDLTLRDAKDTTLRVKNHGESQITQFGHPQGYYCEEEARSWQLLAGFVFYWQTGAKEIKAYLRSGPNEQYYIYM